MIEKKNTFLFKKCQVFDDSCIRGFTHSLDIATPLKKNTRMNSTQYMCTKYKL